MLLEAHLKADPYATCKKLAQILKNEHGIEISEDAVRTALAKHNYKYKKPLKIPFISDTHQMARLEWCKSHLNDNWDKTLFTDETSYWLDNSKVCRWMPVNEVNCNEVRKYPPKLHVWAGISIRGVIGPIMFRNNIDGILYTDILNFVSGDIKAMFRNTRA